MRLRSLVTPVIAVLTVDAMAGGAAADPPLPAAMRARLEHIGPIQPPIVYVAPAGKLPERWVVFVGPTSAFSAWVVTPGQGEREVAEVSEWPIGVRVIATTQGTVPSEMPGNAGEPQVFVLIESTAVRRSGRPAGLRSILNIGLPEPKYTSSASIYKESLPWVMGAKDAADMPTRLAAANAFWGEDPPDGVLHDDKRTSAVLAAAVASDKALAALIPDEGIAVLDTWEPFARETGRIKALDGTPAVKELRDALAGAPSCSWHACGPLLLGAQKGRVVIRAVLQYPRPAQVAHKRRAVPPNQSGDSQTMATARALGLEPTRFIAEAPLRADGGTVGVVTDRDHRMFAIQRDGDWAAAEGISSDSESLRFADFDGDGETDVLTVDGRVSYFNLSDLHEMTQGALELAVMGKTRIADRAAAALALPDDPVTSTEACAVVSQARSGNLAALDRALAPNAEIWAFFEPYHPGQGRPRAVRKPKDRLELFRGTTAPCALSCDAHMPFCIDAEEEGPAADFYLFVRLKGKLRLWRAALYRGA